MVDEAVVEVEQEQLRTEMDESRSALVQKIEQLENKVTETVQSATATVADATASVMESVQSATNTVSETVDSVTSAVQGTMNTVRQSVEGTVDSVRETFDLKRQVERHPWLMMAGAVTVGYFGERLIGTGSSNRRSFATAGTGIHEFRASTPDGRLHESNAYPQNTQPPSPTSSARPSAATLDAGPGFGQHLASLFGPEVTKLQNLVLGIAMGAVRDAVVPSIPPTFQQPIEEIISGFTEKLGGRLPKSGPSRESAEVTSAIDRLNNA